MALIRYTHTRPLQFDPAPEGYGSVLRAGHPVRPAYPHEVDCWWQEEDDEAVAPRESDEGEDDGEV